MKNVLIIGASTGGRLVADTLLKQSDWYQLVGFLDAAESKHGEFIAGAQVLGGQGMLAEVIAESAVDEVIVAISDIDKKALYFLVDETNKLGVELRIIPNVMEIAANTNLFNQVREVNAADLLGRAAAKIDETIAASMIFNKVVMVTGASGSIGSEVIRQIAKFKPLKIVAVDINENELYFLELAASRHFPHVIFKPYICDIRDQESLRAAFDEKPDIVFHAAAHKHVPLMERAPIEAIKNNVIGTLNVLHLAKDFKVGRFILVSTDKAVNPESVMGATKRLAEMLTYTFGVESVTKFMIVRFGNVLGSNGSVIPIFQTLIREGHNLTITDPDATRYFMTIPEAALLVIEAASRGENRDMFVLEMGAPIKIMDIAKRLILLSGVHDVKIEISGLRPGEKLHEQLFYDESGVMRVESTKLLLVPSSDMEVVDLKRIERELKRGDYRSDPLEYLKSYVSCYKPRKD
ncbi:nucleoside-diphosphate sugar epimerase/dehydratase [Kordiimonas aquimaris]|uniref:nucleoside-diphosphate sugar epimerase/dehydratase n=1 Tax=Kordiimonas aquimaris TaxID=707591 RepID=UPI0021CEE227|nr:nucleoside-diphosphate sugar epimerase/dehydratase [Kordiimonas aquimaris]